MVRQIEAAEVLLQNALPGLLIGRQLGDERGVFRGDQRVFGRRFRRGLGGSGRLNGGRPRSGGRWLEGELFDLQPV